MTLCISNAPAASQSRFDDGVENNHGEYLRVIEHRNRIREIRQAKQESDRRMFSHLRMIGHRKHAVDAYRPDGSIWQYDSVSEAAEANGVSRTAIAMSFTVGNACGIHAAVFAQIGKPPTLLAHKRKIIRVGDTTYPYIDIAASELNLTRREIERALDRGERNGVPFVRVDPNYAEQFQPNELAVKE